MWYYADKQRQRQGPVPAEQLSALSDEGVIGADTLVWKQGMPTWQPLKSVAAELGIRLVSRPAAPSAPPPPPVARPPAPPTAAVADQNPWAQPMSPVSAAVGVTAMDQAVPVGFWKRFAAFVLDNIIVTLLTIPIAIVIGVMVGLGGDPDSLGLNLVINLFSVAVGWAYFALQEASSSQATVGKRALNLRVVRNHELTRISVGRATGRYFAKILSGLILLIGYFMVAFTERKQGLHDMLADTLVVAPDEEKAQLGALDWILIVIGLALPFLLILVAIVGAMSMFR